jgi:hypothetical protein
MKQHAHTHTHTHTWQIFKKLVNKNAIKPQKGGPPWQFFLKPLTPPRDFGKNFNYPTKIFVWFYLFRLLLFLTLSIFTLSFSLPLSLG